MYIRCKETVHEHKPIKILGMTWTPLLSWNRYFRALEEIKCTRRMYLLHTLKFVVSHDELWQVL